MSSSDKTLHDIPPTQVMTQSQDLTPTQVMTPSQEWSRKRSIEESLTPQNPKQEQPESDLSPPYTPKKKKQKPNYRTIFERPPHGDKDNTNTNSTSTQMLQSLGHLKRVYTHNPSSPTPLSLLYLFESLGMHSPEDFALCDAHLLVKEIRGKTRRANRKSMGDSSPLYHAALNKHKDISAQEMETHILHTLKVLLNTTTSLFHTIPKPTPPENIPFGLPYLDSNFSLLCKGDLLEVCGVSGSGKTLFCLQTAVVTALRGEKVLFIDCQNNFEVEKLACIGQRVLRAQGMHGGVTLEGALQNIEVVTCSRVHQVMQCLSAKTKGVALVLIDDFGVMSEMSVQLAISENQTWQARNVLVLVSKEIKIMAEKCNVAVLATSFLWTNAISDPFWLLSQRAALPYTTTYADSIVQLAKTAVPDCVNVFVVRNRKRGTVNLQRPFTVEGDGTYLLKLNKFGLTEN